MRPKSRIFKILFWPIFWLLWPVFICNAQHFNSEVKAIIKTNQKNGILDVIGVSKNLTKENKSLHYELSVITSQENGGNSSKNAQTGYFTLEPYETKNLSRTSVSTHRNGRTILLLLIYDKDNELIGTARKVYPVPATKKEENQASYKKPNEGLQLNGMVTERTKTKIGKDFYKIFYQKYRLSGAPGNKIVKIDETISFGRTTKLVVKIDHKILFQFYAKPKKEFLEQMAEISLRRVNRYFEELRKRKEYINQY